MKLFYVLLFTFLSLQFTNARRKRKTFIDMTYVYDKTTLRYPIFSKFKIEKLVKGPNKDLVTKWLQYEDFSTSTHTGTHMDAPAHFVKGEITVDEIPARSFFGKAAVIDITRKASLSPDAVATVEDVMNWERTTQRCLNGTIVLLNSGWGHKWNDRDAFLGSSSDDTSTLHFPGFSPEACKWMTECRSIKGVGVDTASIDPGTTKISPCHGYVLRHRLFALENVANIDKLPISGATLYVFPMKIGKGSGAPTRIVASVRMKN
ncbi:isatin hydrolase-like isoform X1 [Parasteatoda tepidariorum]|uniref:isatin hydrolase-like isoform X1 n=1 Tax=Parasteatoda tepidariorum TaxID=114398 RepID=UPI001C71F541|nr:isatin hydrolase-like [Parasteatoda tepidariorum]